MAEKSGRNHKELAAVRNAQDVVEVQVRSVVRQSVKSLKAFVNQVESQLVDLFRTGLETAYAGSQMTIPYKLTYESGVGKTSFKAQGTTSPGAEDGNAPYTSLLMPASLEPPSAAAKSQAVVPRRLFDNCIHCLKLISGYR